MAHSQQKKNNAKLKLTAAAVVFIAVVGMMKYLGLFQYVSMDNIMNLNAWINGLGVLGPMAYVLLYIAACLFFLPGLPIAVLAGLAFGPLMGAAWALIGATLGASMAFLAARYVARSMVEGWARNNPSFRKIDDGVARQGWRMLMITRLVPVFPFNLQNYAYGLTRIPFLTFVLVSLVCMAPAAVAFTFMGGAIVSGEGNIGKTLLYLGVGAIVFVLISLIPGWMKKKNNLAC